MLSTVIARHNPDGGILPLYVLYGTSWAKVTRILNITQPLHGYKTIYRVLYASDEHIQHELTYDSKRGSWNAILPKDQYFW